MQLALDQIVFKYNKKYLGCIQLFSIIIKSKYNKSNLKSFDLIFIQNEFKI